MMTSYAANLFIISDLTVITKVIVVVLNKNEYYVIELCLEHPAYLSTRAYFQADTSSQMILVSMDFR
jgi:hypothetical protein